MKGSKEFFEELQDLEEYAILMMRMEIYHELDEYTKANSTLKIKQKNEAFVNDPVHKHYVKEVSKAKKALENYEFDVNNK